MSNIFIDKNTRKFSAINFIMTVTVTVHLIVFLLPSIGMYLVNYGGLSPKLVIFGGQVWRLVTYAFLHDPSALFHIIFNMLMLWMFGKEIEHFWGSRKFFVFYFFTAIFAGVFSLSMAASPLHVNIIGASGALMALLVIYAHYFPERQLLFFFIFPMKVKTAVIIYAVVSVLGTTNNYGNISHITHLGGMIAGFLWIKYGDKIDLGARNVAAFFQNNKTQRSDFAFQREKTKINNRAEEVSRILDKINLYGIQSLTPAERKILHEASVNSRNL